MDAAVAIFKGMAGLQGFSRHEAGWEGSREIKWLLLMFLVAWGLPNVQQMLHRFRPALETYPGEIAAPRWRRLSWQPTTAWAVVTSIFFVAALINLSRVSEFLYYQF